MNSNQRKPEYVREFSSTSKSSNYCFPFPKRAAMNLEFSNITFSVPGSNKKELKPILKGVSGKFNSGELIGIVGPSGAGKSTLLNILTGYKTSMVTGEICVNGEKRDSRSFRKKSCYIMQEDHLLPCFSVQELMESTSTLKLGAGITMMEKRIIIADILDSLSLTQCQATLVGSLSGGEKKRLSIALELINNPPLMFFDEPTSGLDSQNSYLCINLLKKLSQEGRTIICTIHQPSARMFHILDHLYALADGQCIYRGSIVDLIPYLSSFGLKCPPYYNPADFLLEVASGEYGAAITQLVKVSNDEWEKKSSSKIVEFEPDENDLLIRENNNIMLCLPAKENYELDMTSCIQGSLTIPEGFIAPEYAVSFYIQFSVLFRRTFMSIVRDKILTRLRIATHLAIGIFIGLLYYKVGNDAKYVLNNIGGLLFCIIFHVFISMMTTVISFPLEMNVFKREHLNHWYSLKAYYFAKTLADIPFQIVYSILYIVIVYFMTSQPFELERFCCYMLICILTSLVAQTIGLAIGAALCVEHAVFLGCALIVPALMFAGFFINFSVTPEYLVWLTYVSYIRYAYEGSILTIYGMNRETLECSESFCMFKYPAKILELVDMGDSSLWLDFIMLIIYFIAMRTLVYVILRRKLKQER